MQIRLPRLKRDMIRRYRPIAVNDYTVNKQNRDWIHWFLYGDSNSLIFEMQQTPSLASGLLPIFLSFACQNVHIWTSGCTSKQNEKSLAHPIDLR